MERIPASGGTLAAGGNNTNPIGAKVDDAAQAAHRTTANIADEAIAQVNRSANATHRAVDSVADAATSAAEWASTIPERGQHIQARLAESASASIRERPIAVVAGALVVGYLLGRLARP